jgi:hypothetical protein
MITYQFMKIRQHNTLIFISKSKKLSFFLTGLKMVVGVGFCKTKVDSYFLIVLKIK